MNALRLDPSERTFAQLYEPRSGPRFSGKTLIAIGITTVCYGGLGLYFMTQKYDTATTAQPVEPPAIVVEAWPKKAPPVEAAKDRPVRTRSVATPTRDTETSPFTPTDEPFVDVRPTISTPVDKTPVETTTAEPARGIATAPGVILNPVWISQPNAYQMRQHYPERAAERGATGRVVLSCTVRANGSMTGCQVVEETPGGWQFGQAALSLARYFKMSPMTIDGQPVEGAKVRTALIFSLEN